MNALCAYVQQSDSDRNAEDLLTILCSRSKADLPKDLKRAWPQIAESLQNRSVQSCHNVCRRKFNPSNYHGNWTEEEEKILINLV